MSTTDHSDSRASLNHTPSSTQKSQKILQKPQFKLCFPKEKIAGKSETRVASIDGNYLIIYNLNPVNFILIIDSRYN